MTGGKIREGTHIGNRLTERNEQVGRLLVDGLQNKEIAHMLGMTVRSVEHHTSKLYASFEIPYGNRVMLAYAVDSYLQQKMMMGN